MAAKHGRDGLQELLSAHPDSIRLGGDDDLKGHRVVHRADVRGAMRRYTLILRAAAGSARNRGFG